MVKLSPQKEAKWAKELLKLKRRIHMIALLEAGKATTAVVKVRATKVRAHRRNAYSYERIVTLDTRAQTRK